MGFRGRARVRAAAMLVQPGRSHRNSHYGNDASASAAPPSIRKYRFLAVVIVHQADRLGAEQVVRSEQ